MGMYNDVICEYDFGIDTGDDGLFQSKNTPAQQLHTYRITESGELRDADDNVVNYTGPLNIYKFRFEDRIPPDAGWVELEVVLMGGNVLDATDVSEKRREI